MLLRSCSVARIAVARRRHAAFVVPMVCSASLLLLLAACGDSATGTVVPPVVTPPPVTPPVTPPPPTPPPPPPAIVTLETLGLGRVTSEFSAEVWVRGSYAYTTSWGQRAGKRGNILRTWDIRGAVPLLVGADTIAGATTTGDVQVSDDGRLLTVATEGGPGSIAIFDVANGGADPVPRARFSSANTAPGVHSATLERVNGSLYAFLAVNPGESTGTPAQLVVLDLSNPDAPVEVLARAMGNPYVHDVFVRDGILFTALWNDGLTLWDIGGANRGGTPSAPVQLGNVRTVGGKVHNVWWVSDPATGAKRYAIVGEEGPGATGSATVVGTSVGDVHVVDVSDFTQPREVAFFTVGGAGTHNFSVDEANGLLYAAFYNAGVRVLDVRGDLSTCTATQRASDGRCNLALMGRERARGLTNNGNVFIWGVHYDAATNAVYASDMLNGLWKLRAATR